MDEEKRTKMLEVLTKGTAADMITRLKHGWEVNFPLTMMNNILTQSPKGRIKKKLKQDATKKRKEKNKMIKEQSRQAREDVEVGILRM